ncbi:unnamed protein product [Dovyalis caffra]|uniref:Uncharacterized protein n=1 Tax=Dovyalis caffra TaxID=77055 RepID=A0AAV1SAU4_9ROSI|nr:unnamed protein product [Dovyalis caffra]
MRKWVRDSFACGSATLVSPDTPANLTHIASSLNNSPHHFPFESLLLLYICLLERGSHVYSSIFIDNLLRAHQD